MELDKYTIEDNMISNVTVDKEGRYTSISKPILTTETFNILARKMEEIHDNAYSSKVYRYIVKEVNKEDSNFLENNELKIVDFIPRDIFFYVFSFWYCCRCWYIL